MTNAHDEAGKSHCADSGKKSSGSAGYATDEPRQRNEDHARRSREERLSHLLVRLDDSFGYYTLDTVALRTAGPDRREGTQAQRNGAGDR